MTTPRVLAAARVQNPERCSSSTAISMILALPGPAWTNQPAVAEAELKLAAKLTLASFTLTNSGMAIAKFPSELRLSVINCGVKNWSR